MQRSALGRVENLQETMAPELRGTLFYTWHLAEGQKPIEEQGIQYEKDLDEAISWCLAAPNRKLTHKFINMIDHVQTGREDRDELVKVIEDRVAKKHGIQVDVLRAFYA
jgi:hypothetical protein